MEWIKSKIRHIKLLWRYLVLILGLFLLGGYANAETQMFDTCSNGQDVSLCDSNFSGGTITNVTSFSPNNSVLTSGQFYFNETPMATTTDLMAKGYDNNAGVGFHFYYAGGVKDAGCGCTAQGQLFTFQSDTLQSYNGTCDPTAFHLYSVVFFNNLTSFTCFYDNYGFGTRSIAGDAYFGMRIQSISYLDNISLDGPYNPILYDNGDLYNSILASTSIHAMVCTDAQWNSGSWWIEFSCGVKEGVWQTFDTIATMAKSAGSRAISLLGAVFPFNLPIQFYTAWTDSENENLPSSLSFISSYIDNDGNISINFPNGFGVGATTTSVLVFGPGIFRTPTNGIMDDFFDFVYHFSTYLQWALFCWAVYGIAKDTYEDLINIKKEDTL